MGITVVNSNPSKLAYTNRLTGVNCRMAVFRTLRATNNMLMCNVPRFHLPGTVIRGRISSLGTLNMGLRAGIIINGAVAISRLFRDNFGTMFVNDNTKLPQFVKVRNRSLGNICSTGRFLAQGGLVGTCVSKDSAPVFGTGRAIIINNNGMTVSTTHATGHLNDSIAVICQHARGRLPTHFRRIRRTGRRKVDFGLLAGPIGVSNSRGN